MNQPNKLKRDSKKRKIGVPRGILLHITLDSIKNMPTSGSELMDEIEYYTEWRPSPGSIYPLLSRLCDQGLIRLVDSDDPSVKRYTLTPDGLKTIKINNEPKRVINLPFKLLGYGGGWLGTYIIFSMIFSMSLRKLLKVY